MGRMWQALASRRGWRALVTAFGLGVLAVLALPPLHIVPVLFLAIPGLIAMIGGATSWTGAFALGLAWGFGFFTGGLYWITSAILTDVARYWWLVPIAVPALALPLGIFVAVPAAIAWGARPGLPRVLVFAGGFVGFELLRGEILTGFPWNLMGTVWAFDALPIQMAAVIGVHGLSLITLLVAATPLLSWRGFLAGMAALAFCGAFGFVRLLPAEPKPQPVGLLIVQGNIAQEMKWREQARVPILRRYVEATREAALAALRDLPPGHRLAVIWPETAVPFLLPNDRDARQLVAGWLPPFVALICYEVIFTGRITPARRPDWIVNVTNDAWFGATAGPWQHLAAARLRAVEEGLPLARAAQTGVSAVFDSRGRLVARSPLGESAIVRAPLPAPRAPTFFAHLGLTIPFALAMVVFALGWIIPGRNRP